MKFNFVQFLMAVSTSLDFVELDRLNHVTNHGKRVAVISAKIGKKLNLTEEEIFDLSAYAVMHDNGYSGYGRKLVTPLKRENHCIAGEENLKQFPFLAKRSGVILYHHENYDGSGVFQMPDEQVPLFSKIIHIADYAENRMNSGVTLVQTLQEIKNGKRSLFSPELTEIFDELCAAPSFGLDLEDIFIDFSIRENIKAFHTDIQWSEISRITEVIRTIIDKKSEFTGTHSSGIAEKVCKMADYYQFDPIKKEKLKIAAHLHDVGKLAMPNEILDKPGALTAEEYLTIKRHTYYTRKVLCQIEGFEDITEWASNHHEKLNGKGYPYGIAADGLDFCSRLMACIDIYQALTEQRPYREGLSHEKTMEILKSCVEKGEIDREIVNDVNEVFQ